MSEVMNEVFDLLAVRGEFRVHRLNEEGLTRASQLAAHFSTLLTAVELGVGPHADPRCLAIVRTKLEEACFFAKKAMAGQYRFQEGNDSNAPSVLAPKVP